MKKTPYDYSGLFGKDVNICDGTITAPSHLKISGYVKMNINCSGSLIITETGVVEGDVQAPDIQIYGKLYGSVHAHEHLVIYKDGEINGQVYTRNIKVEEGALCNFGIAVGEESNPGVLKESAVLNGNSNPVGELQLNEVKSPETENRENGRTAEADAGISRFW